MAPFSLVSFFSAFRTVIGKQKENQYGKKKQSGKSVHFRLDAFFDFRVDLGGKCVKTGSLYKVVITKSSRDMVNARKNQTGSQASDPEEVL